MYWGCIGQCIRDVSWVYYECNNRVSLMYYWCIRTCTLHSCFPSYPGHHLSGAQPIRASSFWHQQPMGMAPGGWGQPWHGSTRHASSFWQAGHAHSSMPSWVLCSRNHSWADCRHPDGAPKVEAPDLTYWAAVGGQTGHKRQWKVAVKSQRIT